MKQKIKMVLVMLIPISLIIIFLLSFISQIVVNIKEEEDSNGNGFNGIYGDTIQEKVWWAMKDFGLSDEKAAAVLGNIHWESGGFSPSAIEGNGVGIGLIQWSYSRRTQLENYAKSKGASWKDENIQIEFLIGEMTPGGGADGYADYQFSNYNGWSPNDWKDAETIEKATEAFCWTFERPSVSKAHVSDRITYAKQYYDQFHGAKRPEGANGTNTAGTGFWWPIGSQDTTTVNGKLFASGSPAIPLGTNVSRGGRSKGWSASSHEKGGGEALDIHGGGKSDYYYIISMANGTVERADDGYPNHQSKDNGGMGNCVYIRYPGNILVRYMHMYTGSIKVKVGDTVEYGQVIGKMGTSGDSTGPHLHLDMWKGNANSGQGLDVAAYLDATNPRP